MVSRVWDKENQYKEGLLKEYKHWVLEVSYSQHTLGCFIIFAKREIERISQLTTEEIDELKQVMKNVEGALMDIKEFKPDRFNYLQLGNFLHHLHFHGIPRYKSPRIFNDQKWIDSTWGQPPVWSDTKVGDEVVIKLRELIKKHL